MNWKFWKKEETIKHYCVTIYFVTGGEDSYTVTGWNVDNGFLFLDNGNLLYVINLAIVKYFIVKGKD